MKVSLRIIGYNIRTARKAAHLTQEQAAEKAGISLLHFGRIERGEREPSIRLLTQIASALHTSTYALLQGCILNEENHPALFDSPDPDTRKYAAYALVLLDEYREQIKRYYKILETKENALR